MRPGYRVVTDGVVFRIQYQRWWWPDTFWRWVRVGQDGAGYDEYRTRDEADRRVRELRRKPAKRVWRQVGAA